MRGRAIFGAVFAATLAVYALMLGWTLPAISRGAGGLAPFDLRPAGYTFDEAQAFLIALSDEARALYLGPQGWLDTVYPALLAAVLIMAIRALVPVGGVRLFACALPIAGALFDYLENAAVAGMLRAEPSAVTAEAVAAAHRWTVLKSGLTTVAMVIVLIFLIVTVVRHFRGRPG